MLIPALVSCLDEILHPEAFTDAAVNGLQVAGARDCRCLATAATASLEAITAAVCSGADTLLVHHGLLWQGPPAPITGLMRRRLQALLQSDLNLIAYHLPLDAHYALGNNRCLCTLAGIACPAYVADGASPPVAMYGRLRRPRPLGALARTLSRALNAPVRVVGGAPDRIIRSAAVCSGAGSYLLDRELLPEVEALITGEIREPTYHAAAESGTAVLVVGHHASEQHGIRRLGRRVAARCGLRHLHLSFPVENGVAVYDSRL